LSAAELDWGISNGISIMTRNPLVTADGGEAYTGGFWRRTPPVPWIVNSDGLGELEFFRTVPHQQARQKLAMWVGGVLPRPGQALHQLNDAQKAIKHGMDKTSFRTPASGKKSKRHR